LPDDIESIKIGDYTKYNDIKTNTEENDSYIEFNVESRGIIRKLRRIRTGEMFPWYHDVNSMDLSKYQILSLEQLNNNDGLNEGLSTNHCLISCLKYYYLDSKELNLREI
jgi:hypothetical protein